MKKFLLVLMLCAASFCTVRADEINWGEKLALYLPSRVLDALDMFSVNVGLGANVEARLSFTRYCDIGLGWNGLVPITAVSALASGRLYALWSIIGMALAVPAAALIRNNCGSILEKFQTPMNNVFAIEGSFWSLENPALWVAGTALVLFIICACFGPKEKN